ncbi:hypothetical protein [Chryseobacterium sp. SIMBA_038]|uniref:hypothetical protein n=2 Tax=Pseudomonadati TaxID=3379134 RepID=UPI00397D799E
MIKQKFGTALFSILAILCFGISIFCLKEELFFSIILSAAAVICTLCAISEYLYHKNKDIIIDKNKLSHEININYSKLLSVISLIGYLIFIILGTYFINMIGFDYKKYDRGHFLMMGIGLYLIIAYSIKIVKILKKILEIDVLVISDNGIILNSDKMIWADIKKEKIIVKQETTEFSKYQSDVKYLTFNYKNKKIEFKIDDLDAPDYFIEQYLKIYRSRTEKNNFRSISSHQIELVSIFEDIINTDDLFLLEEQELNKQLEEIKSIAKSNPQELKTYCASIIDFKQNNLGSIFYALSEESEIWGDFLSSEFIRLFELAKTSDESKEIFNVLDEILYDFEPNQTSQKVVDYLYQELSNKNDKIRLKALSLIDLWLDENHMQKSNVVLQKMVKMTKDENWKIRWVANDTLSNYGIFNEDEIAIPYKDKMKAKFNNQYEID